MTPEDLSAVQCSWSEFSRVRHSFHVALSRQFEAAPTSIAASQRATWLFGAVEDLVGLLSTPSRLADRACDLGATWPDPLTAPSFAVEGRAWMRAADQCVAIWSPDLERSWRQAWLLLSDVLAAEALSPFADDPAPAVDQASGGVQRLDRGREVERVRCRRESSVGRRVASTFGRRPCAQMDDGIGWPAVRNEVSVTR